MAHVVSHPTPAFSLEDSPLDVHQIPAWKDNYIWIVVHRDTKEAAVVDGPEAGPVLDYCHAHGFRWTTVLNTHTHPDHIGINRELLELGRIKDMTVVGSSCPKIPIPGQTQSVGEGDIVNFAGCELRVWLTEGHLDGHISFVTANAIFCGDTLFAGGCGYMFDGPPEIFNASLQRISSLPGDTLVCGAHEYTQDNLLFAYSVEPSNQVLQTRMRAVWERRAYRKSTVPTKLSLEKQTNPFLRTRSEEIRQHLELFMGVAKFEDEAHVFAALRELKNQKLYDTADPEFLKTE